MDNLQELRSAPAASRRMSPATFLSRNSTRAAADLRAGPLLAGSRRMPSADPTSPIPGGGVGVVGDGGCASLQCRGGMRIPRLISGTAYSTGWPRPHVKSEDARGRRVGPGHGPSRAGPSLEGQSRAWPELAPRRTFSSPSSCVRRGCGGRETARSDLAVSVRYLPPGLALRGAGWPATPPGVELVACGGGGVAAG